MTSHQIEMEIIFKRNQTEILKLKTIITEIKNPIVTQQQFELAGKKKSVKLKIGQLDLPNLV